ncbi:hypothetical protein BV22DRAFT_1126201 [Leucogyrophana mollusca]|uniref:Uncharacterized protein n=1 Tax=Leucogyrophana mollusca TaxID=85980 RepID=A0ACB8BW42_9AGAM|nr:hypothetical protein BV22DRAFT_1126201 [Leucogyrophana mollusca]
MKTVESQIATSIPLWYSSTGWVSTEVVSQLNTLAVAKNVDVLPSQRYSEGSFQSPENINVGLDDECDLFQKGANHEELLRMQGTEIAQFLLAFISASDIPHIDEQSGEGGVALVGWSLGAMHVHAMLAYLDVLPEEAVIELGRYLHTVVSHDPNARALGLGNPPASNMTMWSNPDVEERFMLFRDRVTAYYQHVDILAKDLTHAESFLEFTTPSNKRPASLRNIPPEELAPLVAINAFAGSEMRLLSIDESARKTLTKRAIFDKKFARKYLPNVRVKYMCGGETLGALVYAMWELENLAANPQGNHFFFWDDPVWALEQYRQCITEKLLPDDTNGFVVKWDVADFAESSLPATTQG